MGTRADFYVGTGERAEWLGSVQLDGYEWANDKESSLVNARTPDDFRAVVNSILSSRDDSILPEDGWPWLWDDSNITDYTYYFLGDTTRWDNRNDWPNMAARRNDNA